jgi:hypothetical protein
MYAQFWLKSLQVSEHFEDREHTKMGLTDLECKGENCIHLRHDRNKWRARKNDTKPPGFITDGIFLD